MELVTSNQEIQQDLPSLDKNFKLEFRIKEDYENNPLYDLQVKNDKGTLTVTYENGVKVTTVKFDGEQLIFLRKYLKEIVKLNQWHTYPENGKLLKYGTSFSLKLKIINKSYKIDGSSSIFPSSRLHDLLVALESGKNLLDFHQVLEVELDDIESTYQYLADYVGKVEKHDFVLIPFGAKNQVYLATVENVELAWSDENFSFPFHRTKQVIQVLKNYKLN